MERKFLSILLSLLMLLTCIPLGAVSVSAEGVLDGLLYEIVDEEVIITGYTVGLPADLVIPDTIDGYPVTKIASQAFRECNELTSVSIGDEVVEIGQEAFRFCSNLTSVTMTDSVMTIEAWAFCNCWSLASIILSKNITFLDLSVLGDCTSLESIVIPQGVTSIGYEAFSFCSNLTTISIPDSVSRINMYAFDSCPSLETVYYGGTEVDWHNMEILGGNEDLLNATWHYSDGTIYTPVPGLLFEIVDGEVTITGYTDKLPADLVIPDTIRGCPVTKIESAAFEDCDRLVSIVIPDSVVDLGLELTFYNCKNLTTVHFGKGITEIGWNAFFGCDKLRCVDIPEGVTDVYLGAFQACASIEYVSLPKSIKFIDATAFLCGSALVDVYYAGSEEDIARVGIDVGNDPLLNATWHYNCINPKDHYSDDVPHSVMDTERGNGLAFKFELTASVGVKNKNKVDFINATINYLGQSCKLVGMGAVITNQEDATLDLGNVNGKTVIDISTVYLTDWESDSCAFAARVINIPDYALERVVYARPYYIVEVDGEQIVVYGDIDSASCAEYM